MIVIKTTCWSCGEISVPLAEVHLHVNTGSKVKYYSFVCLECGQLAGGEADKRFVGFLLAQGLPAEDDRFAPEMLENHTGAVINYDDILDLHLLLENGGWHADLGKEIEVA